MTKNETVSVLDAIKCPHCGHVTGFDDYIDTCDMSGDFNMDCEACGEPFHVDFSSTFQFSSKKMNDDEMKEWRRMKGE